MEEILELVKENNKILKSLVDQVFALPEVEPSIQVDKEGDRIYKIASKVCNKCNGYITWDDWEKGRPPLHVDADGRLLGDGDCPAYKPR